jgi:dTDP-4-amino-4,6-dideoxygalactose transaminase
VIADTLNIDLALAEAKVSLATKAIMPVHFAGLPVDMDEVFAFAEKHDLGVVEDAAHAFSATSDGAPIGCSKSDAIVFSFYANKTMTTGEGGAIVTRNTKLAQRMRVMRTHGIDRDATDRFTGGNWEYDVVAPGVQI